MQQTNFLSTLPENPQTMAPMTSDYRDLEQYQTRAEWGKYFVSTVYSPGMKVLEPTAGNGLGFCQWIRKEDLTAVEIHPALCARMKSYAEEAYNADILAWTPPAAMRPRTRKLWPVYDLIIGNLPYSRTETIIRHLLPYLKPRGKIAILDRLSLLSSSTRVPFWTELLKPLSITQVPRNVVIEIVPATAADFDDDNIRGVDLHWQFELPQSA